MAERTGYEHGTPCWVDLMSPDRAKSTAFYSGLLGWQAGEPAGPEFGFYTMFTLRGLIAAGMGQMQPEMQEAGMPSLWSTYVWVDDLDAVLAEVGPAGGTVLMPAMEIEGSGRMAMVQDPSGAALGLWEPGGHRGAQVVNEPGSLCWNELTTRDPDAALAFYGAVLPWSFAAPDHDPDGEYREIRLPDGTTVGGVMPMTGPEWPSELPSHWMTYFAVADADASAAAVAELGGTVQVPVFDTPVGRILVATDPNGAAFSLIALNPAMAAP